MGEGGRIYRYAAMDIAGRRVSGEVEARNDGEAFKRLKRDGYTPLRIMPSTSARHGVRRGGGALGDRDTADLLADLASLLEAGADMRSALSILTTRATRPAVAATCRALSVEISGGGALDQAFAKHIRRHLFVSALVAAGEASGDLSSGLRRSTDMLEAQIRIRDQLVSVLSYPCFVFLSTALAVAVILLFVVPTLAPIVESGDHPPPMTLSILLCTSGFLRGNGLLLGALGVLSVGGAFVSSRLGLIQNWTETLLLDGPVRRTASGVVYGAFAIALGSMLAAGTPVSEALRLSVRSVRSSHARQRLESAMYLVRQGGLLSASLERIAGFPSGIARLAAVGEATGALGAMLVRGGRIEEQAALRRIEQTGRILGPALIVVLGGLVGALMAGLLAGVSQLGDIAGA